MTNPSTYMTGCLQLLIIYIFDRQVLVINITYQAKKKKKKEFCLSGLNQEVVTFFLIILSYFNFILNPKIELNRVLRISVKLINRARRFVP